MLTLKLRVSQLLFKIIEIRNYLYIRRRYATRLEGLSVDFKWTADMQRTRPSILQLFSDELKHNVEIMGFAVDIVVLKIKSDLGCAFC